MFTSRLLLLPATKLASPLKCTRHLLSLRTRRRLLYEEQGEAGVFLSTLLLTGRHCVPKRRCSETVTPSWSGQSSPKKRSRWVTAGVLSDGFSEIAGRTETSTALLSALPERAR